MSAAVDTSRAAVERVLAQRTEADAGFAAEIQRVGITAEQQVRLDLARHTTALIRALAAERDAARAESAALRLTLGERPQGDNTPEPIGCPIPGMCSTVAEIGRLRADNARLRAALEDCAEALAVALDRLGVGGHGDHKDRRADADSYGGFGALIRTRAALAEPAP